MINSTTPQTSLEGNKVKPFGLKDKFGYMFGDMANCFLFLGMNFFLTMFYYDALGLNPALVGTMMMVIKFLDAFTDIGMGRVVDRFKGTKAGKFKPWILWLAGPTALSSFLMYQSYMAGAVEWVKWVYVIITYILFNSVFYTGINIPYGSMASAMVTSPQDRAQLSAWRGIGPTVAGLVLGCIPMFFQKYYYKDNGNLNGGFIMLVTGILSLVAVGIYLACYFMCTERVDLNQRTGPRPSILKSLKNIFTSKAFIILAIVTIIQVVAQFSVQSLNNYLYRVAFHSILVPSVNPTTGIEEMVPFAGGLSAVYANYYQVISSIVIIVLVTPVTIQLVKKFGKKTVTIWSCLGAGIAYTLVFAFGFILRKNITAYLFASLVPYIFSGVLTAITFAFINDIIDDMEVKNNVREDAPVYGMYSFVRKFSQGLSAQLGGVALVAVGWVSKIKDATTGELIDNPIENNFHTANAIYNTVNLGSAIVFIAIGLIFLFLYPLGKKVVDKNAQILRERREARARGNAANFSADPMSMEEAASLEAGELIQNEEILNQDSTNKTVNYTDNNDLRQQLRDYDEKNKNNDNK